VALSSVVIARKITGKPTKQKKKDSASSNPTERFERCLNKERLLEGKGKRT
jgi:hypothetical protein